MMIVSVEKGLVEICRVCHGRGILEKTSLQGKESRIGGGGPGRGRRSNSGRRHDGRGTIRNLPCVGRHTSLGSQ
ncbi:hypothetical protein AAC387_Pa07g1739 [Persea americana]